MADLNPIIMNDIDVVLAACLPWDWVGIAPSEPKMILGCLHPVHSLGFIAGPLGTPDPENYKCNACGNVLGRDVVSIRYDEWIQRRIGG